MLKEWKELDKPGEEELKLRLDAAKEKLADAERRIWKVLHRGDFR